jgi:hypothetical protein
MSTIRRSIALARSGHRVLHVVGSRSMARRLTEQYGPLEFPDGGSVEVVAIEDVPRPSRKPVEHVVIDEMSTLTEDDWKLLVSKP